jgi:hypothetical protein
MSVTPKPPCECRICERGRSIHRVKVLGCREELTALVDELHEELGNTEEDLNYKTAILDGSWPQAVELLTAALERAKGKR